MERVYAGDRMSDVLGGASSHTLVVSPLATAHVLRVARLLDVPGVCFAGTDAPAGELVAAANRQGTVLMASRLGAEEICGRLRSHVAVENDLST